MAEFSDLFFELRMNLYNPEAFHSAVSTRLDPKLVDQLSAYAAWRKEPLSQTVLRAMELYMFWAAEDAWRELTSAAESESDPGGAGLNIILERFLTIDLEASKQGLIEGPEAAPILNQFRRMSPA